VKKKTGSLTRTRDAMIEAATRYWRAEGKRAGGRAAMDRRRAELRRFLAAIDRISGGLPWAPLALQKRQGRGCSDLAAVTLFLEETDNRWNERTAAARRRAVQAGLRRLSRARAVFTDGAISRETRTWQSTQNRPKNS